MSRFEKNKIFLSERTFLNNISLIYIHQIVQIALAIASVPIALSFFGAKTYGLIAIIWTFITYLSLVNFGLPVATRVLLSFYDRTSERLNIFFMALKLTSLFSIIFLLLIFISPEWLIIVIGKIPPDLKEIASDTIFITFFIYLLSVPFLIYLEGLAGIGLINRVKIYEIINLFLGFFCLLGVVYYNLTIFHFFLYRGLLTLFVSVIATLDLYLKIKNLSQKPNKTQEKSEHHRFEISYLNFLKTGSLHFFTGISAMLVWHTDNLIVNYFFGLEDVTKYSLTFRLISTAFIIFSAVNMVISPIYGYHYGQRNFDKMQISYSRVLLFTPIIGGMILVGSINFAPELLALWVGDEGNAGIEVIMILGMYGLVLSFIHSHMALVSAINIIRFVPILGFCEALLNLSFSILFANYIGIKGVALGTLIGGIFSMICLPILISKESEIKFPFNWKHSIFQFSFMILPFLFLSIFVRGFSLHMVQQVFVGSLIVLSYLSFSVITLPRETREWLVNRLQKKNLVNKSE